MGTKFSKRLVAVLIALVMVMASAMTVFAAGSTSPGQGETEVSIVNLGTNDSFLNKTFRFKWRGENAKSYKAWMRQKGQTSWTKKATNNQYYEWKGLKTNGLYEFKAEAINGNKSAVSTTSYRWMQSVKATGKSPKKGQLRITWPKVSGATGYQIEYSKSKSMSSPKYAYPSASATSYTLKVGSGTWYWRIRPYKKSGNSYVGIYNGIQSVKVK